MSARSTTKRTTTCPHLPRYRTVGHLKSSAQCDPDHCRWPSSRTVVGYNPPISFRKTPTEPLGVQAIRQARPRAWHRVSSTSFTTTWPSDSIFAFDGWSENIAAASTSITTNGPHTVGAPGRLRSGESVNISSITPACAREYHVDGLRFDGTVYIRTPDAPAALTADGEPAPSDQQPDFSEIPAGSRSPRLANNKWLTKESGPAALGSARNGMPTCQPIRRR